ncbi:putative endo-1,3(4)-beta-glucanase [Apodospora peruviana]|uniref:Endo-1,3(4)-beta-glucanase n=1 Tax=Apodospora peruviana TaxID=516989 RepID=A0AAE0HT86_9PEZI|nr:putative endo-1,3(4)-beta-glucanase [Apodospora peruviana]
MRFNPALLLPALSTQVAAWAAPSVNGYSLKWAETFNGAAGSLPNGNNWEIINRNLGVNSELQDYRASNRNVQHSGGETLQLIPWRESGTTSGWTSGRIESKYTFTPQAGKRTLAQAEIRFGGNSIDKKQGIWPAFWLLGDSMRHGTIWPACGEVDVLETVNGQLRGYGTIHCDVSPGGICNEFNGIGNNIDFPDQGWHTWRVVWDRTPSDWRAETITWYRDGQQFHQVNGARINNQAVWDSLIHKPMYFILNVAVGGTWPGNPNGNTQDGWGSLMEVAYVGHYVSN